jgi:xanthine dehydrogenase accessory factor
MDVYEELVRLKREGRRCALVTIVGGDVPDEAGKLVVREDGTTFGSLGLAGVEKEAVARALAVIASEKAQTASVTGSVQSGEEESSATVDLFIEPVISSPTLYLFGAGQTGLETGRVARVAGFEVVVIDFRPELATVARFPDAREIIAEDLPSAMARIQPAPTSFIFIATPSHVTDTHVLRWALGTRARYIGMIGSRSKIAGMYQDLKISGVPQEALARVHAPVGLDIGAETPGEIAVAVVAEMIACRRSGVPAGGPCRQSRHSRDGVAA